MLSGLAIRDLLRIYGPRMICLRAPHVAFTDPRQCRLNILPEVPFLLAGACREDAQQVPWRSKYVYNTYFGAHFLSPTGSGAAPILGVKSNCHCHAAKARSSPRKSRAFRRTDPPVLPKRSMQLHGVYTSIPTYIYMYIYI